MAKVFQLGGIFTSGESRTIWKGWRKISKIFQFLPFIFSRPFRSEKLYVQVLLVEKMGAGRKDEEYFLRWM